MSKTLVFNYRFEIEVDDDREPLPHDLRHAIIDTAYDYGDLEIVESCKLSSTDNCKIELQISFPKVFRRKFVQALKTSTYTKEDQEKILADFDAGKEGLADMALAEPAPISVELEIEADTAEQASDIAESMIFEGKFNPNTVAEELLAVSDATYRTYAAVTGVPVQFATASPDESGFEIVDVFKAENL